MLDFTSALYLGMDHASLTLGPWNKLTTGAPSALSEPTGARRVAQELAALQGCDAGLLGPSTLHLFFDLFKVWPARRPSVFVDAGTYPIARWGAECATARGARLVSVPHYDSDALEDALRRARPRQPLVLANGWCPGCGRAAPLAEWIDLVRAWGGRLVLDDTQALGILGAAPSLASPYGHGGGGSLRWHERAGSELIVISSLAKAFGVPVAGISASQAVIDGFRERSLTRMHCSAPSAAVIRAAERALRLNEAAGEDLRRRLLQLVRRFRERLNEAGLTATGGLFPVQTLALSGTAAVELHEALLRRGIRTVLLGGTCRGPGPCLAFVISARHRASDIDQAVRTVVSTLRLKSPFSEVFHARSF